MGNYKDKNGSTRIGDFLRNISKSDLLSDALSITGELLPTKGVLGVLKNALVKDEGISPEQRQHALELIKLDMEDMKGVSERWTADMKSDSRLSKNVRPMTLIFLTVMTIIYIGIDSYFVDFTVDTAWIDLLKTLLLSVFIAYFGGRSYEKGKKL